MKSVSSAFIFSSLLSASFVSLHAADQNQSYFDGKENRSMNVSAASFAPTHPDACSAKQKVAVAAEPATAKQPEVKVESDLDGDGVFDAKDSCPETPKGYKVDEKGCPKSVTLNINFGFASNDIPTSADSDVRELTQFLRDNPASKISIIGHTDSIGIDARNQPRSEARARALADKLIASGIESNRIKVSGKGSKEPIASNDTEAGRAQNRRIQIEIR